MKRIVGVVLGLLLFYCTSFALPPISHYYIQRGFELDPAIKLWYPFWLYGAEQTRIIDGSGEGNHGTIVNTVPDPGQPILIPLASGIVTYENMRISSLDGTAFIDFSTAGAFTSYLNCLLVIKDSAGREIRGYLKAIGTGETYTDLITGAIENGNMETGDPPAGWGGGAGITLDGVADERTGGTGVQSISVTTDAGFKYATRTLFSSGQLLKYNLWAKSVTADVVIKVGTGTNINTSSLAWVNMTGYKTARATTLSLGCTEAGEARFDDVIYQKVLTPSATGARVTSSRAGDIYSWYYKDAAFDYNDTSDFTYTIYAEPSYEAIGWNLNGKTSAITHLDPALSTSHTLLLWVRPLQYSSSYVFWGADANHVGFGCSDYDTPYYSVTGASVSVSSAGIITKDEWQQWSVVRSGVNVTFYKNGVQIGDTQVLAANNSQILQAIGQRGDDAAFVEAVIGESVAVNKPLSYIEVKDYYELTRHLYSR